MAQTLRVFLVGTLLVCTSSAVAIAGVVSGDRAVALIGLAALTVILLNEILAKDGLTPLAVPRRLWRRRKHARQRDRWRAQQREYEARVEPLIAGADYQSWKAFYAADDRRRAKEVALRDIADGELWWHILWLPTTEVVAWPFQWRDERMHRAIAVMFPMTQVRSTAPAVFAPGPAPMPETIYILGRTETAEEAKRRIATAATFDELRAALDQS